MKQADILHRLEAVISQRKQADSETSYVAKLIRKGRKHIAKKVAEEAAEVAMAAVSEGKEGIIYESADLLFHLMVLCADAEIEFSEVLDELAKREGLSGLDEKRSREE